VTNDLSHIHSVDDGRGLRRVFLDGVEMVGAIECDTKSGWIKVLSKDADGKPYLIGDEIAYTIKMGDVCVECVND
jgi:hypothetical protein